MKCKRKKKCSGCIGGSEHLSNCSGLLIIIPGGYLGVCSSSTHVRQFAAASGALLFWNVVSCKFVAYKHIISGPMYPVLIRVYASAFKSMSRCWQVALHHCISLTLDAVFTFRHMVDKVRHMGRGNVLYACAVDCKKAFDKGSVIL